VIQGVGRFGLARLLPFIESVGEHQAAALLERTSERRLFGDRLRPRVNRSIADRKVVGPAWHESPTQHDEFVVAVVVCFPSAGTNRFIEPEVLSKGSARYLATSKRDVAPGNRLVQKAKRPKGGSL